MAVFTNKYAKNCNNPACRKLVPVGAGFIQKINECWVTWCADCVPERRITTAEPIRRVLTSDGKVLMPYEAENLSLLKTIPGARFFGKDKGGPFWQVSLADGDRQRVLEIADRLNLEVAPQLRNIVLTEAAQNAVHAGLYEFQVTGVNWMSKRERALLADQMGLGKTIQALVSLPSNGKGLVVCPATLKLNWRNEAQKWRPDLKVVILSGENSFRFPQDGELVITNYDILADFFDPTPKVKGCRASKMKWEVLKLWREKLAETHPEAKGVTVIFDEAHKCFPYHTQIPTDQGYLSIGDIVENELPVRVATWNFSKERVEYQPISWYYKNKAFQLVKVTHEFGEFTCTATHKIWTDKGYLEAKDLQSGAILQILSTSIFDSKKRQINGKILQSELCIQGNQCKPRNKTKDQPAIFQTINEENLSNLRNAFSGSFTGQTKPEKAVLLQQMCGQMANEFSSSKRASQASYSYCSSKSYEKAKRLCQDESQQSNEKSNFSGENEEETSRTNISQQRGQRTNYKAATIVGRKIGFDKVDGTCDFHIARKGYVSIPPNEFQSRYSTPISESSNRSGREQPQNKEMEIFGQAQNNHPNFSRVVGVEILEQRHIGELGQCGEPGEYVYNIEVAPYYNYFVRGKGTAVLVANCKNYKSERSRKVRELSRICTSQKGKVWALTGTPLDNKPSDLYGMLDSLDMAFQVFTPRKGQKTIQRFQELFNCSSNGYGTVYGAPEPIVPELLRRVMLRRRRTEVLPNLPRKTYSNLIVGNMDPAIKQQLDEMWEETGDILKIEGDLPPFEKFSEIRAKLAKHNIPAMLEYIEECEEQEVPLVVFSAHLAPTDVLLGRPGWAVITGATSLEKRQEIVDAFQAGRLKGVALTIRAGGVGLNLHYAWKVLFVDLDWVPGWNAQAEDRVCRIGQESNKVEITRMVNDHPLTLHILNLLTAKIVMIEAAVEKEIKAIPNLQPLNAVVSSNSGLNETEAQFQVRMNAILTAQTAPKKNDFGLIPF